MFAKIGKFPKICTDVQICSREPKYINVCSNYQGSVSISITSAM